MTPLAYEVNFDGIVGPTHNYAGLSRGNLASQRNRNAVSNPKAAALQGLAKMKMLADLGIKQAVLPPQHRPDLRALRRLGFVGTDAEMLLTAQREAPHLLACISSSSGMWAANAATVSPSCDTSDGRVHITPANLITQFHRALEPPTTAAILQCIFNDDEVFAHRPALPSGLHFADEGAANHTRLCGEFGQSGVEMFVYGREAFAEEEMPSRFPARQTAEASAAVARLHQLDPRYTIFARQNPSAIDAGVFHNDVICVGHRNVLLYHAAAFLDADKTIAEIRRTFVEVCHQEPHLIEIAEDRLPLGDAVESYLFNSQLVTREDGEMVLIAPSECQGIASARETIDWLIESDYPIHQVHYVDVRESMRNGGGPACLRLRVELTPDQMDRTHQGVLLTASRYDQLVAWVERRYRDCIDPKDLADPLLADESQTALDELTQILKLGSIYPFQIH